MKRTLALMAALALGGCASAPEYIDGDFVYQDFSSFSGVGVRALSKSTGMTIAASGECSDQDRNYSIQLEKRGAFGGGENWLKVRAEGLELTQGEPFHYHGDAEFLAALRTLEVVGAKKKFDSQKIIKVSTPQMSRIPELCKQKYDEVLAYQRGIEKKKDADNDRLIADVVNRTGVQPMLSGYNQMDFNNLVFLFRKDGAAPYQGKFVWAKDGSYVVSQVLGRSVLLLSMTSPTLFPAITIMTDKQAIEGQFWSQVSIGPLQFVGVSNYRTALGVTRQTLLFKTI